MLGKTYDLVIAGGGFAGTALAYYAAKLGAKTLLLEAGSIGSGTSAACAGRAQIIESETEEYLSLVMEGYTRLAGLGEELGIDLEWETPGHITLLFTPEQIEQYQALVERVKRFRVVAEMLEPSDLPRVEPNLQPQGCLGAAYSTEGHLNPFRFLVGFARGSRRYGAELHTHTPITRFDRRGSRIEAVICGETKIYAGAVVLAAGAWTGSLAGMAGSSLPIQFTHAEAVVSEPLPRFIHHHIGMSGFYEVVHGQDCTVTLGLGQHRNGTLVISNAIQQADQINLKSTAWGMPALAQAVLQFFPKLRGAHIVRTWAAPSPFLPDFCPAIGLISGLENVYAAAGFHLALPTIPVLVEELARALESGSDPNRNPKLRQFAPERFTKSTAIGSPLTVEREQ